MTVEQEHPFAAFGLPGEPGSEVFWASAGSPASVPADGGGGWVTLFLWRGSAARIGFESWSPDVPCAAGATPTAGTRRCACRCGCG